MFATPSAAYYHVDLTHSQKAIKTALKFHDETKTPPICVSDAYPAYIHVFETTQYCWAHLLQDTKAVNDNCLAGKILHDEMVDMFQRIKALQKKLRVKNEAASEKVYQKALKEINDIAEARYCKKVEKIQKHLKRCGAYYLTCLKHPQIPMENGRAFIYLMENHWEASMGEYGVLLTVLTTWKLNGFPVGDTLRSYIGQRINQAKLLD